MGRDRLRPDLRRLPTSRRPRGRSARASPHPDDRPGDLHHRIARMRAGNHGHVPDHGPRSPGIRRGDRAASGLVDRHEHVPGGCRPQQGARRLGRHRRERCDRRPDRGRAADPVRRLGVHLLPQRPDRCRGDAADPATGPREPTGRSAPPLRPVRGRHRHCRDCCCSSMRCRRHRRTAGRRRGRSRCSRHRRL